MALKQLTDHEEADEPIEDDGPDFVVPSRQLIRTPQSARQPRVANVPLPAPTPKTQNRPAVSETISPRTAQAAYPTPQTSIAKPYVQSVTYHPPLPPLAVTGMKISQDSWIVC